MPAHCGARYLLRVLRDRTGLGTTGRLAFGRQWTERWRRFVPVNVAHIRWSIRAVHGLREVPVPCNCRAHRHTPGYAELGRYRQLRGHAVAENAYSRFKRGVSLSPGAGPLNGVRLLRPLVPEPNRKSLLRAKSKVPVFATGFRVFGPRRHRLGRIPIS
jgi:hypothetical protein